MKHSQFDPNLIRQHMSGTDVLDLGIDYYLREDEKRTEEEATELAYAFALKYCRKWYRRDRKDPETRHARAYDSFAKRVYDGQYFHSPRRQKTAEAEAQAKREADAHEASLRRQEEKKAQAEKLRLQKLENERKRIAVLRERCVAKGLVFEAENIRQLKRYRAKKRFIHFLTFLLGILTLLSGLAIAIYAFVHIGDHTESSPESLLFLVIVIHIFVGTAIVGNLLIRTEKNQLPDEVFDPIRKKKKKQDSTLT